MVRHLATALASVLALVLAAPPASAQTVDPASPHESLVAHPVAKLLGVWRGEGWMMNPDRTRTEFTVVERVRWNLAGTALIVEGVGFSPDPDTGELVSDHDALAVFAWDEQAGAPVFHARRAGEPFRTHEVQWRDDIDALVWHVEPDRVRFTITIGDGVWTEVGDYSPDGGETWFRFLEMKLTEADR